MMNGSKPRGASGGGRRGLSPKRRRPRLRLSCSPSPALSPQGEGETFASTLVIRPSLVVLCLRNERHRSGVQPQRQSFPAPFQRSPSPGREGWGEGKRSKLQSQAHDDSRNCQTLRVPRQSQRFLNSIMSDDTGSVDRCLIRAG